MSSYNFFSFGVFLYFPSRQSGGMSAHLGMPISGEESAMSLLACMKSLLSNKDFVAKLADDRVQRMLLHW